MSSPGPMFSQTADRTPTNRAPTGTRPQQGSMAIAQLDGLDSQQGFLGYPEPTSNTTYVPNQFFDVVLRHGSRGAVRLVGYMMRRTLGWCDSHGRPRRQEFRISFSQIEREAGISRPMIRPALDEALAAKYIRVVEDGRASAAGKSGAAGVYAIKWDLNANKSGRYVADPDQFAGFFSGQGNHSAIPDKFFDYTLLNEPLSVVKVVGTIIRNTIGWQTEYGFRRQEVQLSYGQMQQSTGLSRDWRPADHGRPSRYTCTGQTGFRR